MKNYYKILQIDPSAEREIIDAAYRRLMKKYHPDVGFADKETFRESNEKVREIIEAYEILSDEEKRQEYDNAFQNYVLESKQRKFVDTEDNLISRSILIKCSISSRTYEMQIVKSLNWSGPYIVKAFELVDEETVGSIEDNNSWLFNNFKEYGTKMLSIFRQENVEEEIHLGDIDWSGVKCPDCNKVIQVKPGIFSAFSLCPKCHRMKCTGASIKGVAGYSSKCPWCGKNNLIVNVYSTGSKGGSKITGVSKENKKKSIPRLPGINLLDKK